MRVETDDEIYRVNAVWLGPPKATTPWTARYIDYGLWLALVLMIMGLQRQIGIGFGFFSTAWAVVLAIACTKFLARLITDDRPLGAVVAMWLHELRTPRPRHRTHGASTEPSHLPVRTDRPRPRSASSQE